MTDSYWPVLKTNYPDYSGFEGVEGFDASCQPPHNGTCWAVGVAKGISRQESGATNEVIRFRFGVVLRVWLLYDDA